MHKYGKLLEKTYGWDRPGELDSIPSKTGDQTLMPDSSKRTMEKPPHYHQGGTYAREETNNPAKTKSQQKLFGIARGIQKGEVSSDYSPQANKIAKTVSSKTVKEFARRVK